jgi:hypothetical protein
MPTRTDFVSLFETIADAIATEDAILNSGAPLLDNQELTSEDAYWSFMIGQAEIMLAESRVADV